MWMASGVGSGVFLNRKLSHWIRVASVGLQHKISDYRRDGDQGRADKLAVYIPIMGDLEATADEQALDITRI